MKCKHNVDLLERRRRFAEFNRIQQRAIKEEVSEEDHDDSDGSELPTNIGGAAMKKREKKRNHKVKESDSFDELQEPEKQINIKYREYTVKEYTKRKNYFKRVDAPICFSDTQVDPSLKQKQEKDESLEKEKVSREKAPQVVDYSFFEHRRLEKMKRMSNPDYQHHAETVIEYKKKCNNRLSNSKPAINKKRTKVIKNSSDEDNAPNNNVSGSENNDSKASFNIDESKNRYGFDQGPENKELDKTFDSKEGEKNQENMEDDDNNSIDDLF